MGEGCADKLGCGCRVMLCEMGAVLNCMDMAAKQTTLSEIGETLTYVVDHMVTKEDLAAVEGVLKEDIASVRTELKSDIAALGEQTASIERDLKQIRRDLYELADKVENIGGYRKEIDHALERIAAIERHLGIKRKAAA
jgi:polyhydroxyalkanoate synthesis regulator phasin